MNEKGQKDMPKLRLLSETYAEIKKDDPNTALTMNALRCLVKTGEIPSVQIGRKRLVNYEKLLEYLAS